MRRTLALALTLSFSLLGGLATTAHAQESTTRGFNLGLHATGASLVVEDGDRNNAGGGGIWVGYGFNRTVLLFFQADGALFATVTGDAEDPVIASATGEPLTFLQLLALRRIVDGVEDVFDFLEDLLDPVDELIILAIIL